MKPRHVSLVATATLLLAACGGNNGSGGSAGTVDSTQQSDDTLSGSGDQTLTTGPDSDDEIGADSAGGDAGEPTVDGDGVGAMAGQVLGSCSQLNTATLESIVGEPVFVGSDEPPVSPYRECTVYSAAHPEVALGYVHAGPDLDGAKYRLIFADLDTLTPLDGVGDAAGWTEGLLTLVRVEQSGAEFILEARQYNGGIDFSPADATQMAAAIPGLAAELVAPAQFDLPPAVSSCEDIFVDDVIGETTGSWTTASFDGKLHCVAETDGGNRVSVVIGGLGSADDAVLWTNLVTDEMLEHGAFDEAYPIQMRSDDLDRGYSSFEVSVLTDYEAGLFDGETISADITVGSRGRFVALFSVMGPIADDVNLYTSDTAEILGELLSGIDSDYDPAEREENTEEVVANFFTGPEINLAGLADDFGNCENIDIAAAMAVATMSPASMSSEGGWLDNNDTLLYCNFYPLDSDGEPSIDLGRNPLSVEVWNGSGEVPWAEWESEDHEVIATPYGTLRYLGPDNALTDVFFTDGSGPELHITMLNKRANPVTLAEVLEVLTLAVNGLG